MTRAMTSLILILVFWFLRSSNEGLKIDVLLKFQFASNNADEIKRQAENILHQKLKLNDSCLTINTSLPYLRGKKYDFSSLVTVLSFKKFLIYRGTSLFHHKMKSLFNF